MSKSMTVDISTSSTGRTRACTSSNLRDLHAVSRNSPEFKEHGVRPLVAEFRGTPKFRNEGSDPMFLEFPLLLGGKFLVSGFNERQRGRRSRSGSSGGS